MKLLFLLMFFLCTVLVHAQEGPAPREITVSTSEELITAVREMPWTGGKIYLKPGTYVIKETLRFGGTCNLTLEGAGRSSVIRRQGFGDLIVFEGNCWHDIIKNLSLEGDSSAASGSGIVFVPDAKGNNCGNITINQLWIDGFPQSGIRFEGDPKSPLSSCTISDCWLTNNREHQLYCRAFNDFYISGNQFGGGGCIPTSGCFLDGCSAGTYTMNYHWDNRTGLLIGGVSNFDRIENNRFEESAACGLQIGEENAGEVNYAIITGNTIHTNSKNNYGVYNQVSAFNAKSITFTGNQIFSWNYTATASRCCLYVAESCREWIIKDNIFHHFTEKALFTDKNGKHIIKDNITGEKLEVRR